MPALRHGGELVLHVVSKIVEAELVVGGVGDVAGIGRTPLRVIDAGHDHPGRQAEEGINLAHPFGVTTGQIVVHGDDMHALALKRVQIHRKRRDERLALARLHFGDPALVQDHAADELNVEMTKPDRALGAFPYDGESLGQKTVERFALGESLAKLDRLGAQRLVIERGHRRLEIVDRCHLIERRAKSPVILAAKDALGDRAEAYHAGCPCPFRRPSHRAIGRRLNRSEEKP